MAFFTGRSTNEARCGGLLFNRGWIARGWIVALGMVFLQGLGALLFGPTLTQTIYNEIFVRHDGGKIDQHDNQERDTKVFGHQSRIEGVLNGHTLTCRHTNDGIFIVAIDAEKARQASGDHAHVKVNKGKGSRYQDKPVIAEISLAKLIAEVKGHGRSKVLQTRDQAKNQKAQVSEL